VTRCPSLAKRSYESAYFRSGFANDVVSIRNRDFTQAEPPPISPAPASAVDAGGSPRECDQRTSGRLKLFVQSWTQTLGQGAVVLFLHRPSRSAMQAGPRASTHAVPERSYVEYRRALAELQNCSPFGVRSARHQACSWSHPQQHKWRSSCARLRSLSRSRDKDGLGVAL
jgi:hypothetical protein